LILFFLQIAIALVMCLTVHYSVLMAGSEVVRIQQQMGGLKHPPQMYSGAPVKAPMQLRPLHIGKNKTWWFTDVFIERIESVDYPGWLEC
jgi:hypothetical protein